MSLKNSFGVALTAAALATTTTSCNDEHPTLCSTEARDQDGKKLPIVTDQNGKPVAVPCQCETEDKPEKAIYYSADDPTMPYQCQAEVNAMIGKEIDNNTGGTGGSAGSPGVAGSGNYPGTGGSPSCNPTTEVCDGYDNDCDGQVDEGGVCDAPALCEGTVYLSPDSLRVFVAKCANNTPYVSEIGYGGAEVTLNDNGPCVVAGVFDKGMSMNMTGNTILALPSYQQGPSNPIDTKTYPAWADSLMNLARQGQLYLENTQTYSQQVSADQSMFVGAYCDPAMQYAYSAQTTVERPENILKQTLEAVKSGVTTTDNYIVLTSDHGKIKVEKYEENVQ